MYMRIVSCIINFMSPSIENRPAIFYRCCLNNLNNSSNMMLFGMKHRKFDAQHRGIDAD